MPTIRTVWITRAQPGAERTAERLSSLGFTSVVAPLLAIRPLDVTPDLTGTEALAFTSRNGVRTFAALTADRTRPVFAVGDATTASARDAGFTKIRSAGGDIHALAALIRAEGRGWSILHPGAAEPAGDLSALVGEAARVTALAVYEAMETGLAAPQTWDAVLIHSPRAARVLAATVAGDMAKARLAVAISEAAARPLNALPFAEIRSAAAPTETSLRAALGKPQVYV